MRAEVIYLPTIIINLPLLGNIHVFLALLLPDIHAWAAVLAPVVIARNRLAGNSVDDARTDLNKELSKKQKRLFSEAGLQSWRTLTPLLSSIPIWVSLSLCLRQMTSDACATGKPEIYASLGQEGFLFVPDLTMADPTMILPIVLGLSSLATIELTLNTNAGPKSKFTRLLGGVSRSLSLALVPIACTVPVAMSLYWTVSAVFGLGALRIATPIYSQPQATSSFYPNPPPPSTPIAVPLTTPLKPWQEYIWPCTSRRCDDS